MRIRALGAATVMGMLVGVLFPAIGPLPQNLPAEAAPLMDELAVLLRDDDTVRLEARPYILTSTLDLRGRRVSIEGVPGKTVIRLAIAEPNKIGIDLTGAVGCTLRDVRIETEANRPPPMAGILLARRADAASSHVHEFSRVTLDGRFLVAPVVNIGSEVNRWYFCVLMQRHASGTTYYSSAYNRFTRWGLPPLPGVAFETAKKVSNAEQVFYGCSFNQYAPSFAAVWLDSGTWGVRFRDCNVAAGAPIGAAWLLGENRNDPLGNIIIDGCWVESFGCDSAVRVLSATDDLRITGTRLFSKGTLFDIRAVIRGFVFDGTRSDGGRG